MTGPVAGSAKTEAPLSASSAPPVAWPRPEPPEATPPPPAAWPVLERLLANWRALLATTVAAALLGLLLAFLLPKHYTSSASFIPGQRQTPNVPGALAGLVGQFGLFGEGGGESPEFYQRLLSSRQIRTQVLTTPYQGRTLVQYYRVSGKRDSLEKAIKKLSKDYSVSVDRITKIVKLDVELKSPILSQTVAARLLQAVDSFNSNIRRTMAGERRQFIERQFEDAGNQMKGAEAAVRDFNARNRSISDSPMLQFERSQLERRVELAGDLYRTLARDLQTAQIDEVNDTPVISVIDPPSLPVKHSSPRLVVVTLLAAFFGLLLGTAWTLARERERVRAGG